MGITSPLAGLAAVQYLLPLPVLRTVQSPFLVTLFDSHGSTTPTATRTVAVSLAPSSSVTVTLAV